MIRAGAAMALLSVATPAFAQIDMSAWATTDERRHGLSWSDGRPTIGAAATFLPADTLRIEGDAIAARGATRLGGADAAIGLAALFGHDAGGIRIEAGGRANLFPGGRGALDHAEAVVRADWTIGPARLRASADYAPRQRALGGSLLHLRAGATVGVIGTPWTLSGAIGRTSGDTTDPARSARLRPDATYLDWRLGAERAVGPLTVAVDYVGTDLRGARHGGDTVLLRVSAGF